MFSDWFLFLFFEAEVSVLFVLMIEAGRSEAAFYASSVSIGRHQSSGFVLRGAGLQMWGRWDIMAENISDFFVMEGFVSS